MEIHSNLLARNTLLNLGGRIIPSLIGVITIPFLVRGLGIERFGLLSLAWTVLGYFTIFDLGLGRATTKYVSEALSRGEETKVSSLVWTAVAFQGIFGLVGALVFWGITPLLVRYILNISPELIGEAKTMFYWLAAVVPVVVVSNTFSGALEAAQRFDLVNAVRVPLYAFIFLMPLVGTQLGLDLPGIIALILVCAIGALAVLVVFDLRVYPQLKTVTTHFGLFPHLFGYGGWVTVSSVVGPILVYLDRFLIASLVSVAAVVYYTAPHEVVTRLLIIPYSLAITLFPVFSGLGATGGRHMLDVLFTRSVKYVLLIMGPITLTLVLFAREVLQVWLGSEFSAKSFPTLQILALGLLIGSLAQVPFTLLQGVGRPDIPAKFHLLELPVYVGTALLLISFWGIAGAAWAWTLRTAVDALLLYLAAHRVCRLALRQFVTKDLTRIVSALSLLAGISFGLKSLAGTLPLLPQAALFIPVFGWFAWIVWRGILDASDRRVVLDVLQLSQRSESKS